MLSIFLEGFLLQASLIRALGAQNIFVLNSGLRREHHLLVASVCSLCDSILILVGVLGVATVFVQFPILKIALGVVGVGFLLFYGFIKLKDAKYGIGTAQTAGQHRSVRQAVAASLAFSLLNPHVYLDTVVLIGGYSSQFSLLTQRFSFGAGASTFSILWFFGLAIMASVGNKLLNNSKAMRTVSLISGIILVLLGIKLGIDVLSWMKD